MSKEVLTFEDWSLEDLFNFFFPEGDKSSCFEPLFNDAPSLISSEDATTRSFSEEDEDEKDERFVDLKKVRRLCFKGPLPPIRIGPFNQKKRSPPRPKLFHIALISRAVRCEIESTCEHIRKLEQKRNTLPECTCSLLEDDMMMCSSCNEHIRINFDIAHLEGRNEENQRNIRDWLSRYHI